MMYQVSNQASNQARGYILPFSSYGRARKGLPQLSISENGVPSVYELSQVAVAIYNNSV